jgi:hypothetical protein
VKPPPRWLSETLPPLVMLPKVRLPVVSVKVKLPAALPLTVPVIEF